MTEDKQQSWQANLLFALNLAGFMVICAAAISLSLRPAVLPPLYGILALSAAACLFTLTAIAWFKLVTSKPKRQELSQPGPAAGSELNDVSCKLDALSDKIVASDAWLKQRQEAFKQVHRTVAEQALTTIDTLKRVAAEQSVTKDSQDKALDDLARMAANMAKHISWMEGVDKAGFADACGAIQRLSNEADRSLSRVDLAGDRLDGVATDVANMGRVYVEALSTAQEAADAARSAINAQRETLSEAVTDLQDMAAETKVGAGTALNALKSSAQALSHLESSMDGKADASFAQLEETVTGVADTMLERFEAVTKAFDASIQERVVASDDLTERHKAALDSAIAAFADGADTLGETRQAARAVADGFTDVIIQQGELKTQFSAMHDSNAASAELIDALSEPLNKQLSALQAVDISLLAGVIDDLRQTTDRLHGPVEEQVSLADALRSIADKVDVISSGVTGIEQLKGEVQALPGHVGAALSSQLEDQGNQLDALSDQSAALHQLMSSLGTEVARQEAVEALSKSIKSSRNQMRQMADQTNAGLEALEKAVTLIRSNSVQTLKQRLRHLPDEISGKVSSHILPQIGELSEHIEAIKTAQVPIGAPEIDPDIIPDDTPDTLQSLADRLHTALQTMHSIEEEVTALATAALAAPQDASGSNEFKQTLQEAEQVFLSWGGSLDNVSTAIALARDAA